ncbi:apolipoprotein N-acyltransferase [Sulfurimonas sp. HSL-3221]|uniref:apolipoprotein N-acyltransferase n=1 Tax=Sulfurimonadaceae TaxID=2771471 RepID=UPI001E41CA4A|nr:apolipoprotein N-acyltransferase [Sulfurimonas sp. HSL-3221]UFS63028.1 apolipoprotein N-acyltransferase [Sulfurimonas sp. HSL-3221]
MPFMTSLAVAFAIALAFSTFIYVDYFALPHIAAVETLLALGAYYGLLAAPRRTVLQAGFLIGIFWFYWIGFSFRYYGMPWAMPLMTLLFGVVYLLYFGVLALSEQPLIRALLLFGLTFVAPMGFNWMVPELPLLHSYLGVEKWQFALILFALAAVAAFRSPLRFGALLFVAFAYAPAYTPPPPPPLKIKLAATAVPQELKWEKAYQVPTILGNFARIDDAAAEGYDLIILPESVFPLFLNKAPELIDELKARSEKIAIVTGALLFEDGNNYNVTYFFHKGQMQVAKKMVLVPFGEYIPLPKWMGGWVNEVVFDGASDYLAADHPTDFLIGGTLFRNAVCYEATTDALFTGDPEYMIAISNNAWFTPSIEPTLQRLLMTYYARRHHTRIFHCANAAGTGILE